MITRIIFKLFLPSIALLTMFYVIFHINPYKAPHASPGSRQVALQNFGHLPLAFEANIGQTAGPVKFISRGNAYTMFLTGTEAVLALRARDQKAENKNQKTPVCPARMRLSPSTTTSVLRLQLVGADDRANVMGLEELPGKTNYFIGNDPKKWRTDVPNYAKVKYEQVYPGVDLVYYGNQRQLEYDFVVAPNADPHAIRFAIQNGVSRNHNRMTRIDANGDLVLASDGGDVRMHKPVVYQPDPSPADPPSSIGNRQFVEGHYILTANNQVSLQLGTYDRTRPLVIDPVVSYATYLGGSGGDIGFGVAVDSSGNAYVVGRTGSSNFPTSSGAYDTSCGTDSNCNGSNDAFLTKLSADGSSIVYSTYLGGSGNEMGLAVAVDGTDNAYLTGLTSSTDFPTTSTAFQKTLASSVSNAFVTKLNAAGNALVYSTYLGGNGSYYGDVGVAVAVDASGTAYVSGQTDSSNFPVKNAIQSAAGGGLGCTVSCDWFTGLCTYTACPDAFVTKLSADGSSLVYSTYLGKQGTDSATSVAVDSNGNAYVGGYTNSSDFPTHNALQPNLGGGLDGFVLKLNPSGSALVFSTFLGGSADEYLETLTIDSGDNIYVGGATSSTDFPTVNPSQSSNAGQSDAFVTEINAAGSSLVFSTYLGGTGVENALGIALDTKKNIYVMGETTSSDFPTVSPTQASPGGGADAFVAEFPAGGGAPLFATYLGGSGDEAYNGGFLAVDGAGNIIVVGDTASSNFPVVNALQPTYGGNTDAFVAKYSPISGPAVSLSPANLSFGDQTTGVTSAPKTSTLTNSGNQALTINSIALSTGTEYAQTNNCPISPATLAAGANCTISVTFKPTTTGTQDDSVVVASNAPGSPNTIPLTGNGVPPTPVVTLSQTSLTFPDQLVNTKGTAQTVTLTNSGSAALTISTIASQTADFTESNDCPISPSKLAISSHCTITVNFDPGTRGSLPGSITITDDAADSPQSIPLSGKGVIAQVLQLSTNTLDFLTQLVGSTSTSQTVTLTNGGDQNLTLSSIAVTGDFAYTTTCSMSPATMSGGSTCTVTVKFTPTLTGTRDSTLTITHNAAGSPSTVTLKGTGTDFALGTQSGGSTSATVTAGGSATYNLQIAPTGYSGNVALSCSFQGFLQPRGTNCAVPSSVTLNGVDPATFTVSVTTTARSMLWPRWPTLPAPWKPIGYITNPILLALLLLAAIAAMSSGRRVSASRTTKIAWVPAAALLVITMIFAAYGCGGGGSTQIQQTGTPAGTYNLTLNATAGGMTKSSILTLTVN
jgi:hypothetical protein